MKLKTICLFILLFFSNSLFSQILTVLKLHPAFDNSSQIIISDFDKEVHVTVTVANKTYAKTLTKTNELTQLEQFIQQNNLRDSIAPHSIKSNVVLNNDTVPYLIGFDGLTVFGYTFENSKYKNFAFWSPRKGDLQNDLLIKAFNYIYSVYKTDKEVINYFENIEGYFNFSLKYKLLPDSISDLKIYGSLPPGHIEELKTLFDPEKDSIFLDVSNLEYIDSTYFKFFSKQDNVYFVDPSFMAKVALYEIGVNDKYILSQYVIKRIKSRERNYSYKTRYFTRKNRSFQKN